jgi:hypothetical protein
MLVNFLIGFLDAYHNAGLVVVATMCDMGAKNVKALKQVFLKRHLSSGFVIKKLQQCLILLISLSAHVTFSLNMK